MALVTMNHADIAMTNPISAPIIHFLALSTHELSPVIPELICICTAWYMRENIATVPAIPRSIVIRDRITVGIVLISTLPSLRSLSATQRRLVEVIHPDSHIICQAGHGHANAAYEYSISRGQIMIINNSKCLILLK
jgi:hypothetical protein